MLRCETAKGSPSGRGGPKWRTGGSGGKADRRSTGEKQKQSVLYCTQREKVDYKVRGAVGDEVRSSAEGLEASRAEKGTTKER